MPYIQITQCLKAWYRCHLLQVAFPDCLSSSLLVLDPPKHVLLFPQSQILIHSVRSANLGEPPPLAGPYLSTRDC